MEESITLSEQIYTLGIHPEKGGIVSSAHSKIDLIIIGALFLELRQNGHIEFENKRIVVRNTQSKVPLYKLMLDKLKKKEKPIKISRWMQKLSTSRKQIRRELQKKLVKKRIVRLEAKRFLFFTWKRPVLVSKAAASKLVSKVQNIVFSRDATSEDLQLLSLIKPAGLLKRLFPERSKRKKAKKQISQKMVKNDVSEAVANAIAAAEAVAASVAVSAAVAGAANS